ILYFTNDFTVLKPEQKENKAENNHFSYIPLINAVFSRASLLIFFSKQSPTSIEKDLQLFQ
ncbi:28969_t:CDS:1, partial [Gigaspora margarita]